MTEWHADGKPDRSGKAVVAVTVLALLLVAALPLALLAGVIVMAVGHVAAGLIVLGGSVLVATIAVALAGVSGLRRLRKLISRSSLGVVPPGESRYGDVEEPADGGYTNVVQLDRSEYTDVN